MSAIGFILGLVTIAIPAAIVLRTDGFTQDQRARQRRRSSDGRRGGRRTEDLASA